MTLDADLLQRTLDLLILQIVWLGPLHGYAIVQRLSVISKATLRVNQGSLYPALCRLERRRRLRSDWHTSESGRDARCYALTAAGRKQLEVERGEWTRLTAAIAVVLQTAK